MLIRILGGVKDRMGRNGGVRKWPCPVKGTASITSSTEADITVQESLWNRKTVLKLTRERLRSSLSCPMLILMFLLSFLVKERIG